MKQHPAITGEREAFQAKVMQIGGGSTEIMKDLAARQLGWEP